MSDLDDLSPEQIKARLDALAASGRKLALQREKQALMSEEEKQRRAYWKKKNEEDAAKERHQMYRCAVADEQGVRDGGISGIFWSPKNRTPVPTWPEYIHWSSEAEKAGMPFPELWAAICAAGIITREWGRR